MCQQSHAFWVNNDCDRWDAFDFGTDSEQDDLSPTDLSTPFHQDCYFVDLGLGPEIPCTRDLEDYARLWIPGLSNLIHTLPTNYGVNLQWRNNAGAGIRIFEAAEADGGTNYLFDTVTASNQVNVSTNPFLGYVSSSSPLVVHDPSVGNPYAHPLGDHFIFCGTSAGNDELVLQVTNQYGGEVGEASVFLNLKDIKQMYERWTVGDDPTAASNNIAIPAYDGLPPGVGSFQYPYDSQTDSTLPTSCMCMAPIWSFGKKTDLPRRCSSASTGKATRAALARSAGPPLRDIIRCSRPPQRHSSVR